MNAFISLNAKMYDFIAETEIMKAFCVCVCVKKRGAAAL